MSMQRNKHSDILQAEKGGPQDNKNARNRRANIRPVPSNHRQAERILIKAVESGELKIDKLGKIWRLKVRKGKRAGGSRLVLVEPRRAEYNTTLGYLQIRNTIDGKRIYGCAHRLVWQYFFGDIPNGLTINHKNGVKGDNKPKNLEVATYSENRKHAFRIGLINQNGEKNPNAKISDKDVQKMRRLYSTGKYKQIELAARFGICFQAVSEIVRGLKRKTQNGPTDKKDHRNCRACKRDGNTGRFLPREYPKG